MREGDRAEGKKRAVESETRRVQYSERREWKLVNVNVFATENVKGVVTRVKEEKSESLSGRSDVYCVHAKKKERKEGSGVYMEGDCKCELVET